MSGPLAGIRVIDLSTVVMGPYAAQILGDLGADVVKIESPGDTVRVGTYQRTPGMTPLSLAVNRNKRSVALNLKDDEQRAQALRLIDSADALITNMRPGALARLGLTYEHVAERNPKLVYAHAQGFRSDSPQAGNAAYDETIQASSGLVDLTNRAIGKPVYLPTILGDKVSALTIVYSVLAALLHQRKTGEGQYVEVPMTDTMIAFNLVEHLAGHTFEPPTGRTGFALSMSEGHQAVPTKDGLACVIPYNPQNFRDFFTAAGRPDLAEDPRVNGDHIDSADAGGLHELIEECSPTLTTDEWAEVCAKHSIPFAPVLELDCAEDDPYVAAGGLIQRVAHPTEGPIKTVGIPVRFSATPASIRRLPSLPGQDTEEVLKELDA
ncbi:crotonobetainyl-CoA:carnitine CoA-transferase CaiB-like acyl-CoA transferase [Amycolatopsis bartoniae]|uniref:CoA transferase n=1 Tax=Amycolatopsis bartoniae TaxID=941986 RepID=A0A8H9IRT1_9PSEU|nr:CoA transferase [Amycolatopsis bartoniae]MBB2934865.1 crotonobetainyl-CoA:carnitine CoA-transferase CaiB-like acyl-CoA transferase [Amycolatopsis bartoniae]TVT00751.1 CoA transferase [Amycolatopsis bartoniae]GHF44229.1 CoA transferase [Amycolatopsis bartoniae]